jgi:hypothetical protein
MVERKVVKLRNTYRMWVGGGGGGGGEILCNEWHLVSDGQSLELRIFNTGKRLRNTPEHSTMHYQSCVGHGSQNSSFNS